MVTDLESVVVPLLVLLLVPGLVFADGISNGTSFSFPSFVADDDGRVLKVADITYNASFESFDMNHKTYETGPTDQECGKLLYRDRVRMVDRSSGRAASFTTSFTFAFQQHDQSSTVCGAGMAFTFVARSNITAAEYTRVGRGMCAFDIADKSTSNRALAVKFDSALTNTTGYDDPSDSNIGVVVSSRGNTNEYTYNLCGNKTRECAYFCGNKGDFSAWVDYDSVKKVLEVWFRNGSLASGGKPGEPIIRVTGLHLDNSLLEDEDMYVGFSGSTFWSREIHRIRAWNFNSSALPKSSQSPPKPSLFRIVGISCGAVMAAGVCLLLFKFKRGRTGSSRGWSASSSAQKLPMLMSLSISNNAPRAFKYRELRRATKNFSDSELLSGGSFGDVFKGTLPSGALVAIKRIKNNREQGEESFLAEATSLRQIRHRNLLQLRGWCEAKEGLLLVYDYLSNGSLDKWLHRSRRRRRNDPVGLGLAWTVRRSILAGVASGLAYLHEEWVQCIIHRDVKSSNVMLDANFNAYLGDFGLARLVDHHKLQKTTLLAGTLGYMAPEMQYTGRASKETDVYAFGILLLEVVCGRRPLTLQDDEDDGVLLDMVWRAHEAGNILAMVDPKLLAIADPKLVAMADPKLLPSADPKLVAPADPKLFAMATPKLVASKDRKLVATADPKLLTMMDSKLLAMADPKHVALANPKLLAAMTDPKLLAMADPKLSHCEEEKTMAYALHVGLLCCLANPSERPSMRAVSQWFQSSTTALPPLPSTKQYPQFSLGNSQDLLPSLSSNGSTLQTPTFSDDAG